MKQEIAAKPLAVSQTTGRILTIVAALLLMSNHPTVLSAQTAPAAESTAASTPLKPHTLGTGGDSEKKPADAPSLIPLIGSLIFVLGLFFALAWAMRRMSPAGAAILPAEAFEMLGRAPLANRQQANLIRCGGKLLLISASATGAATLAEITDPAEVERLTVLCRQSRPTPLHRTFWQKGKNDGR